MQLEMLHSEKKEGKDQERKSTKELITIIIIIFLQMQTVQYLEFSLRLIINLTDLTSNISLTCTNNTNVITNHTRIYNDAV